MFDLVVIGGGPAGVTAALRARELGATVALVERGRMGGTCTNTGCVPTRVLAKAARLVRDAEQFEDYGITSVRPTVDFPRLLARTQQIIGQIQTKKDLIGHLTEQGVTVKANSGAAHFTDEQTLTLPNGETLQAKKFMICVGGHARKLPFPGSELALTHSDVWSLPGLPNSVILVGSAATGAQLASVLAAFGSPVTLLETAARILPGEDEIVSQTVADVFRRRGIEMICGITQIVEIEKQGSARKLHYVLNGEPMVQSADTVIFAVGWPGNLDTLSLDKANVKTQGAYIQVDDAFQTSNPRIFAAGDITGRMMLVQSAVTEGRLAVESALLSDSIPKAHAIVPHGGFTDPEYGSVGLTETAARERGECAVAVVPMSDLDRAVIDGRPEGVCKLIVACDTRLILGAHVVGEQALEIIEIVAAGMAAEMTVSQLAELELAYPTFSGIVSLAARQICRDLGIVSLAPDYQGSSHPPIAEWERSQA